MENKYLSPYIRIPLCPTQKTCLMHFSHQSQYFTCTLQTNQLFYLAIYRFPPQELFLPSDENLHIYSTSSLSSLELHPLLVCMQDRYPPAIHFHLSWEYHNCLFYYSLHYLSKSKVHITIHNFRISALCTRYVLPTSKRNIYLCKFINSCYVHSY